jgi:hypothetical protein
VAVHVPTNSDATLLGPPSPRPLLGPDPSQLVPTASTARPTANATTHSTPTARIVTTFCKNRRDCRAGVCGDCKNSHRSERKRTLMVKTIACLACSFRVGLGAHNVSKVRAGGLSRKSARARDSPDPPDRVLLQNATPRSGNTHEYRLQPTQSPRRFSTESYRCTLSGDLVTRLAPPVQGRRIDA